MAIGDAAWNAAFDRAQYRYDHMEPPDDTAARDAYESYCIDNGVDSEDEDFEGWIKDQEEEAAEARAEQIIDQRRYGY